MTRAVLTFHSVHDSASVLSFPTKAFRKLVERLAATGTPVVEFAELLQRDDGVTITFDGGMRTVHQYALPVLRQHGFPAHLFLTPAASVRTSAGRRNTAIPRRSRCSIGMKSMSAPAPVFGWNATR